ncbi:MAG: AtzH-like domain-containing protein [Opitutales bacterium]
MNESRKTEIAQNVVAAFKGYEAALVSNDIEALQSYFHQSPDAIRFGVNEQLYGYEAIAQFRKDRVINFRNRTEKRFEISVLSETVATTMYEYSIEVEGVPRDGRQSQTWLFSEGNWKIITAHVSLLPGRSEVADWKRFAQENAACLDFTIDPAHLAGVVQHLETMDKLVEPLMDFELPEDVEPAPVFRP